jgi:hypothetical protein
MVVTETELSAMFQIAVESAQNCLMQRYNTTLFEFGFSDDQAIARNIFQA